MEVSCTLSDWMEVALWPGISSDARLDEFRRRTRIAGPGGFRDAPVRAVLLATVTDSTRPETVIVGGGLRRPLVIGHGGMDLTCAQCQFVVCESVGSLQHFAHLMLECPGCGVWQRIVLQVAG